MSEQFPFNALRAFEAVARNGSFSRAGDELCVTQSAISHQVKLLEQWLGGPLIHRKGNGLEILPHGLTLANGLATAFEDIQKACRRARETAKPRSLVIAVIPSVATCWLIPRMSEFRRLHPDISTRIIYAIHGQPIDFRDVDVAITYSVGPMDIPGTTAIRLLPGESAPVCSRSFLEQNQPLDDPSNIAMAGLLHDTDMVGWHLWFQRALGRRFTPPDGPIFEDFNLLRAATLAGQGISLCPISIIHDDLQAGRLVKLSNITVLREHAYYMVLPDHPSASRRREEILFRDWLESVRAQQDDQSLPAVL